MNQHVMRGVVTAGRPADIETRDGVRLFYRDWAPDRDGGGGPVVLMAGWGLPSDAWGAVMARLCDAGLRCVAYDRRGVGRSDDPGRGYDLDTLADDLAAVLEALDLTGVTLVGHSMASAEMTRYLTRYGGGRVARVVFLAPTTPCLGRRDDNPNGLDPSVFAAVRAGVAKDFPRWMDDNGKGFLTADAAEGTMAWIKAMMTRASIKGLVDCNKAMTEADLRAEVAAIDVPALVIQGDADMSGPLALTGAPTAALLKHGALKVYEGGPHGLMFTHVDVLAADLAAFATARPADP